MYFESMTFEATELIFFGFRKKSQNRKNWKTEKFHAARYRRFLWLEELLSFDQSKRRHYRVFYRVFFEDSGEVHVKNSSAYNS